MLHELRWRLTWLFVLSTTTVFLAVGLLGGYLLPLGLTMSVDEELKQMAAELYPLVNLQGQPPAVREWRHAQQPTTVRLLAYIQIFDAAGKLVEEHGTRFALPLLRLEHSGTREMVVAGSSVRIFCQPLRNHGEIRGWLQISRPIGFRQSASTQYYVTLAVLTAALFFSSIATGYQVAGRAILPVKTSFESLRCFVADAGHELKTPLTLINGNLEALVIALSKDSAASLPPNISAIQSACDRMNLLVNDLLLLARLESSPVRVFPRRKVDLAQLIHQVVDELTPLFEEKRVALKLQVTSEHLWCHSDSLQKALSNLIRNALAYTPAGGSVAVSLTTEPRTVNVVVSDTGAGIPPEQIPKIFDRFYRGCRPTTESGSGLGLSIAQAVVKEHGGTLKVQSRVGQGSTFTVTLPRGSTQTPRGPNYT